jgi:large subunit ribosomal protein L29
MKSKEVRELTTNELRDLIRDESLNLTKLRLAHAVSPVDSPVKLRLKKRLVARLKTELTEREIRERNEKIENKKQ